MVLTMKKIKITVAGMPYNIATDNDINYTLELAGEIDSRIQDIMKSSSFISPTQATVLALLEYADAAKKASAETETLKRQLKEYLADAAQAKSERDMLRRELAKIKKGGSN